jgi:hypothetical protein
MICPSCQAENKRENLFCTKCGERFAPPSAFEVASGRSRRYRPAPPGSPDTAGLMRSTIVETPMPGSRAGDAKQPVPWSHPGESWPAPAWSGGSRALAWDFVPPARGLTPYSAPIVQPFVRPMPPASAVVCADCGQPRSSRLEQCPHCSRQIVNNSGQNGLVPAEVADGWNWGAFAFPVLWSMSHEVWFGLFALIPGLDIIVRFVLASRGNQLAWQRRRFQSVEQYQDVQRIWRNAGIGFVAVMAAFIVIMIFSLTG